MELTFRRPVSEDDDGVVQRFAALAETVDDDDAPNWVSLLDFCCLYVNVK